MEVLDGPTVRVMTTPDPTQSTPSAPPPQGYGPPPQGYGPPPQGYGPPPQVPGQAPQGWAPHPQGVSSDDRTWALLAHLSIFVLGLIGPLVIYLVKKDSSPFVRHHAGEALNFHITVTIAAIVSFLLMFVLIGLLLLPLVIIGACVLGVLAAVAANKGDSYRYPLTLRLVS